MPSTAQSYTATYTAAAPPSGLAGAWGFNEGSGTTTADASGNGNTATLLNGPTWVAGKYGNGLSFDGANDNLSVAELDVPEHLRQRADAVHVDQSRHRSPATRSCWASSGTPA